MVKLTPLGGLGEIGLNTMLLEARGERLLIDCGLMFPRADQLGVDVVVPDFRFVRHAPLSGVVLTHAHEDHLGALPWLLREQVVPIYGTRFTLALARHKLAELGLEPPFIEIEPLAPFTVGSAFRFEALRVTHSVPDAVGYCIESDGTRLIHTGDFKLDGMPVDGQLTDLSRVEELGQQGVDLLLSDSTNAEVVGSTASEQVVRETFLRLFREARERIILSLFGSHLHRVRHAMQLAEEVGRKVVLAGRSLQRNVELARAAGIFPVSDGLLVPFEQAQELLPERALIICTGAQAEPRAALRSMLSLEPGPLRIQAGDLVLLSSRTIPGNEPQVSQLINDLLARGARVLTSSLEPGLHVSGHGAQAELRRMLTAVEPKRLVPIHGERRHLEAHAALARQRGTATTLMVDGDQLQIDANGVSSVGQMVVDRLLTRRDMLGSVTEAVLHERRMIASDGLVTVVLVLGAQTPEHVAGPFLRGSGLSPEEHDALSVARNSALHELASLGSEARNDVTQVSEALTRGVRRTFKQLFGSRPLVNPIVLRDQR